MQCAFALLLLVSLQTLQLSCAGRQSTHGRKIYNVTNGFRNPYHKTNFKRVDVEKDADLKFPTTLNKIMFTSLADFKERAKDGLHPYAFQFLEKDVKDVLGPAFDLARSIVMDPFDMEAVNAHNAWLLNEPLAKQLNWDCQTRCPNPDVYEPHEEVFMKQLMQALRFDEKNNPGRFKKYGKAKLEMLQRVPKKESVSQHDINQFLDQRKVEEHREHNTRLNKWNQEHQNITKQLYDRFNKAWKKMDHADLYDLEEMMDEAEAEIDEVETEMEKAFPGGPMWRTSGDHMWSSTWNMNTFDRYLKYTPDVMEPLAWFLDQYPAPFHNSGKFYYPPGGTRQWHTNVFSGGVGWRAYIVRKWPAGAISGTNLMHPNTGDVFAMPDHDEMAINIFRINDLRAPLWHCVYSESAHRFSLGIKFADEDVFKILTQAGVATDSKNELDGISEKWNKKYDRELVRISFEEKENKRVFAAKNKLQAMRWAKGNLTAAYVDMMGGAELADQIADVVANKISDGLNSKLLDRVQHKIENIAKKAKYAKLEAEQKAKRAAEAAAANATETADGAEAAAAEPAAERTAEPAAERTAE